MGKKSKKAIAKEIIKRNSEILNYLNSVKPVGKDEDMVQAIVPPLPADFSLSSPDETKALESYLIHWTELNNILAISIQRSVHEKRKHDNMKYLTSCAYCKESGRIMHAARLPSGQLYLIDGNSRRANYHEERYRVAETNTPALIDLPEHINLIIHDVNSMEDAETLYYTFDAAGAVETVSDKMSGASESLGLDFQSPLLLRNKYKTGLLKFAKKIPGLEVDDISEERGLLEAFQTQLHLIDNGVTFDKQLGNEIVSIMAAMLYKHRQSVAECKAVVEFANSVALGENQIITADKEKNGIARLVDEYNTNTKRHFESKSMVRLEVLGLWIYYYGLWRDGNKLTAGRWKGNHKQLRQLAVDFLN